MDPLKTAPFELGSGTDACLLVHGFTGSPWDMRPLGDVLAQRGFYVRGMRLPGHGETPRAMERVTAKDWERAIVSGLEALGAYRQVFVAGLSMGALLSVILAAEHPHRVGGVALLAPAMRFLGWQTTLLRQLQRVPGLDWSRRYREKFGTDLESPLAKAEAPLLAGFPLSSMKDMWVVQHRARQRLARVRCPAMVVAARNDHVVTLEGARELARGLKNARPVRFIELERGYHIIPRDLSGALAAAEIATFFERARAQKDR